jgi:hypothetical protein
LYWAGWTKDCLRKLLAAEVTLLSLVALDVLLLLRSEAFLYTLREAQLVDPHFHHRSRNHTTHPKMLNQ